MHDELRPTEPPPAPRLSSLAVIALAAIIALALIAGVLYALPLPADNY